MPTGDASQSPTGTVFAGGANFLLAPAKPALFMWVTEHGTISGWNPGVNPSSAVIEINTTSRSVFKGAALATIPVASGTATFLYVADFRGGRVPVYDQSFHSVPQWEAQFVDFFLPHGYAPFNVQNIGGEIYVSFAKQDSAKHDEVDGPGLGYVDVLSP